MEQLLLHLFGDYILQNDWMAQNKKAKGWKGELACQIHCVLYSLPFLLITSPLGVFLIYIAHYALDRTNIVTHLLSLRNTGKWDNINFGFSPDRPIWLTVWLNIFTDNTLHLIFNWMIILWV